MTTLYKVLAKTGYRGHREGETFEADLTEDQERRAKARGDIRVVRRDKHEHEKEDDDA
jgi:hypothetical protein